MPLRVLSYQVQVWERQRKDHPARWLPPIIAVVVNHAPRGWTAARAFEDLFDPQVIALPGLAALIPHCALIMDDLAHLRDDQLEARSLRPFPTLALWLLRDARDPDRLLGSFDRWSPLMLQVERASDGRDRMARLISYLFHVIDPTYRDALRAKLSKLSRGAKESAMTIADQIHEEGRIEGLEQGRVGVLRSLLTIKFQSLDAGYEALLQAAPPSAIDRYLARVLVADSLAAVFAE